jgi:hypothetical protein
MQGDGTNARHRQGKEANFPLQLPRNLLLIHHVSTVYASSCHFVDTLPAVL